MSASDTKEGLQRCHADVLVLRVTLKGYNYKKQPTKTYPTLAKPSFGNTDITLRSDAVSFLNILVLQNISTLFSNPTSLKNDTRSDGVATSEMD